MRAVVVPSAPVLLPEYGGLTDPLSEVREACRTAVRWLLAEGPAEVGVLTAAATPQNRARGVAESAAARIGRLLLAEAGFAGSVGADRAAPALLVVANGSACRGEKAPGHLDERSFGFDEALGRALAEGDSDALAAVDARLGADLWCHDVPALRALAAATTGRPVRAETDWSGDPFGVQYWVVRWTCGS